MTQALNHCSKAIESFTAQLPRIERNAPLSALGFQYIRGKLEQAQVFLLPDNGMVMERNCSRPDVPGIMYKPAFPVTALEYNTTNEWHSEPSPSTPLNTARCPKRIALAWQWADDLPFPLSRMQPAGLGEGVVIASVSFVADAGLWMPMSAIAHMSYDAKRQVMRPEDAGPIIADMIASRRIPKRAEGLTGLPNTLIPILPEVVYAGGKSRGADLLMQALSTDLMDEVNAYLDLCLALGCGNVGSERHPAPEKLNQKRVRAGKPPLKDFHILTLNGQEGIGSIGSTAGHSGPRPHLRRGHIRHLRHLGPDRITWVNASMVRGKGGDFVSKVYDVRSPHPTPT